MTYGALWAWAKDTVSRLRTVGVGQGDRVAVALPDGPETAATIISVAAGAVCAPLNPAFTSDEWHRYLIELRATALLTDLEGSASQAAALALGIPVLHMSPSPRATPGQFTVTGPGRRRPNREDNFGTGDDDALILLTSGTTSKPKTVPLTHTNVCLSAYNVGAAIKLRPQDRLLSVLPLFQGHGLISGVIAALSAGSSVVCTSGFDAEAFFAWLMEFRPTWYTAVPAIHRAVLSIAEKDEERPGHSSLRLIRSASSTLPARVLCRLETLFGIPVIDTFGMTEAATQIAANPLGRRKLGSVGRSAGADIAILDTDGRLLPSGERGEIALRGPTVTRGYDNDPAATQQAFRNGWFRTGDLGYLDDEGYLFLVGRIKDVINRGGQKVAPGEVEDALLTHPDVVEAAAFAIPHVRLGADIAAAVVLSPNAAMSAQELRTFVRKRLASFKVPGLIRIVPHIPKSAGGKIKRGELAAAFTMRRITGQERGAEMALPGSQLERELARVWAELLDINQIGVDSDVFALGADLLTVMQMILHLRDRFGANFSFKDIFEAPTVSALAARLNSSESLRLSDPPTDIESVELDSPKPVSIVQERMLRIERELPGLPQFNLPFVYRLRGRLNVPALKRSLAEVVHRHESLRTGFTWRDELPVALITPAVNTKSFLIVKDLAARAPEKSRTLLLRKAELEAEQRILEAHRHERCAFVPGAAVQARRQRSCFASGPARYHHRRLVDGSLHGGAFRTLCRFFSWPAGAVAGPSASVFRLCPLAASMVQQRCSIKTVCLLEEAPAKRPNFICQHK